MRSLIDFHVHCIPIRFGSRVGSGLWARGPYPRLRPPAFQGPPAVHSHRPEVILLCGAQGWTPCLHRPFLRAFAPSPVIQDTSACIMASLWSWSWLRFCWRKCKLIVVIWNCLSCVCAGGGVSSGPKANDP